MKENLKRYLLLTIGSLLSAYGVYAFAVKAGVPVTGIVGIATILYRLFKLPIGITNIILNIPVILICYKLLGKKYLFRSIYCMVMYSVFTDYILCYVPTYSGDRFLAAICCGVIMSIGDSIIYMSNASTGGFDFISIALKVKRPHLKLGNITFVQSLIIILLNGIIFKDIDSIIYGAMMSYLSAKVINYMITGFNKSTLMLIVTDRSDEVNKAIDKLIERGTTILYGKGGYQGDKKDVVMCACGPKEVFVVQKETKQIDANSFMILLESSEIHGEGFKLVQFGDEWKKWTTIKLFTFDIIEFLIRILLTLET